MARQQPRHILITGASSGIGAGLARHYAASGVVLHLCARSHERLDSVSKQCRSQGAVVHDRILDVTNMVAMNEWIAEMEPSPELVVANAGISSGTQARTSHGPVDQETTRDILATNIAGVINTVLPAVSVMKSAGSGQIAIVSSMAGYRGLPSAPAYSASKAAVKAYGEALRPKLARHGILVNVVMPGFVESHITDANNFAMPMIMSADRAARKIAEGLGKNKARIAFPWSMAILSHVIGCLPPAMIDPLLARLPSKN